ncbi:50S ribosomal protein L30 [Intestinibaculum porci]|jgi:large subunit ribosomal protein L30|uniref:Large ribosomal subunit protein uL30 n=1 Tax=Intestinibaculum porci TaxID=2487118 RepID=A0A3G9JA84_9FIRM|nr:50S ribosomal protein L30 [Intestinibaculum porci]MDD6349849.1 50S ribosomal protein L30 [Intestinibaculum porci]MDD6422520.1 50S ribosomal protein L30 [Intestinibaculum porci]BBH27476.1 50S ribosomal protein L30 [Intestinibaculum porci]
MAKLSITLTKSPIGAKKNQKATLKALGLNKMHKTVEREDNAYTQGMIRAVAHLVTVTKED